MVWYGRRKGKVMQDLSIASYSCFVGSGGMSYRKRSTQVFAALYMDKTGLRSATSKTSMSMP